MIAVAFVALTAHGCPSPVTWHRLSLNEVITPEAAAFIVSGKTPLSEVVRRLGAPDEIAGSDIGPMFRYRFIDAKRFRITPTWGLPFAFPVLNLVPNDVYSVNMAAGGAGGDEFQVFFDAHWVVQRHAFAHHAGASRYFALPFDVNNDAK